MAKRTLRKCRKKIARMTTVEQIELATGSDKLRLIGAEIDRVKGEISRLSGLQSTDDQAETIEVEELASKYDVREETLRKNINVRLGKSAVIRVGKKWVLRKTLWLEYLKTLESLAQ